MLRTADMLAWIFLPRKSGNHSSRAAPSAFRIHGRNHPGAGGCQSPPPPPPAMVWSRLTVFKGLKSRSGPRAAAARCPSVRLSVCPSIYSLFSLRNFHRKARRLQGAEDWDRASTATSIHWLLGLSHDSEVSLRSPDGRGCGGRVQRGPNEAGLILNHLQLELRLHVGSRSLRSERNAGRTDRAVTEPQQRQRSSACGE
ncbi:hypothetical protein MHYP_G00338000 [Metynnis hypsauchen]